jgi:hypothetical protein
MDATGTGSRSGRQGEDSAGFRTNRPPTHEEHDMNHTPARSAARRVVPRLAAAATVTAALVTAGGTGPVASSSSDEVVALVNAWPKKYTGVGVVVEPSADAATEG